MEVKTILILTFDLKWLKIVSNTSVITVTVILHTFAIMAGEANHNSGLIHMNSIAITGPDIVKL